MNKNYYVYVIFRPNGIPCYVGKGKGTRWKRHNTTSPNKRLARIIANSPIEMPTVIVRANLSEEEAFLTEKAIVAAIGRGDSGPLVNLTDGGEGFSGGRHSPEFCEKTGSRTRGKPQAKEHTEKIRAALTGIKHPPRSQEDRIKLSLSLKASVKVAEHISDLANKNRGIPLAEDHKRKISVALTGGKRSDESRAAMRAAHQKRLSGTPRKPKPWIDLGMSQTTWRRHQKEMKVEPEGTLADAFRSLLTKNAA